MTDIPASLAASLADRYRLERELGQGGMAAVYLAHDLRHDREVAVKVPRPELAAVIGAGRFLSEIKTTANLQHPHILPLFDSGRTGGRADGQTDDCLYYVMPYIEGESLRDRLHREKQLPIADAIRIASEIAGALDYAHRPGVIHRDIKPENILLHDGRALVADFGIALAASKAGGSRMTETGMSLGTPTYMSPEQAMGEREITARSDVYARGCVLYEMLVGDPPFIGSTAQAIVAKVMTETPAPPSRQRPTVPDAVEDAVLIALHKLPADRFGTAAEFAAALTACGVGAGPTGRGRMHATPAGPGPAAVASRHPGPLPRRQWPGPFPADRHHRYRWRDHLWRLERKHHQYPLPASDGRERRPAAGVAGGRDGAGLGAGWPGTVLSGQPGGTGRAGGRDAPDRSQPRNRIAAGTLPHTGHGGDRPTCEFRRSPDGRSFAMVRRSPGSRIVVIQNLAALLRKLRSAGSRE